MKTGLGLKGQESNSWNPLLKKSVVVGRRKKDFKSLNKRKQKKMDWKAENALNGLISCPAIAHIDVQQQDDVHKEGIHDGGDVDDLIV